MLLPLTLGLIHAFEPDHVAAVTGVSLSGKRRAWQVGLAFGLSHMVAVALLAALSLLLGHAVAGDKVFLWLDRMAWTLVLGLGLWNLSGALGWRRDAVQDEAHHHGPLRHHHPHGSRPFHHGVAWMGAFFGLGGVRGFTALAGPEGIQGLASFAFSLLLFGLGIVVAFIALSWASGWIAGRVPRRLLLAVSGIANIGVGFWLLG